MDFNAEASYLNPPTPSLLPQNSENGNIRGCCITKRKSEQIGNLKSTYPALSLH